MSIANYIYNRKHIEQFLKYSKKYINNFKAYLLYFTIARRNQITPTENIPFGYKPPSNSTISRIPEPFQTAWFSSLAHPFGRVLNDYFTHCLRFYIIKLHTTRSIDKWRYLLKMQLVYWFRYIFLRMDIRRVWPMLSIHNCHYFVVHILGNKHKRNIHNKWNIFSSQFPKSLLLFM